MGLQTIQMLRSFYPEPRVGGYSRIDLSVEFYTRVAAILRRGDVVLDYGAGRGGHIDEDVSPYRKSLKTLLNRCAHVEGCDIDAAVLHNPYIDHATVIQPSAPLPFPDEHFDLVICNWVFEHIQEPEIVSRELLRVLKPGGYICAMTPNKWGYVSAAARSVNNRFHAMVLNKAQPERLSEDVFPTVYKMNTEADLARLFGGTADVTVYRPLTEPSYYFSKRTLFRFFTVLHWLMPTQLRPTLLVFLRKV
jgi:SAM-dependent methyltransferase